MKAIVYSAKPFEIDLLEKANSRAFEFKYVKAQLCTGTAGYAAGYDAAIVFVSDQVTAQIISIFSKIGVKLIITRSTGTDHIDLDAAKKQNMEVRNVPAYSPHAVAEHAVALALALGRVLIPTYDDCRKFDFRVDQHIGFNFFGKTVGIVGLGKIGEVVATIYNGLGCRVLGYDVEQIALPGVEMVSLSVLLKISDIITLHVPYSIHTHYLINKDTIDQMKNGVMLINTSRGKVVHTDAVIKGLDEGKIGYFGMDVYEYEKDLFFEDHQFSLHHDLVLTHLMSLKNVVVTPHQAFLTREAVAEIARSVVEILKTYHTEPAAIQVN